MGARGRASVARRTGGGDPAVPKACKGRYALGAGALVLWSEASSEGWDVGVGRPRLGISLPAGTRCEDWAWGNGASALGAGLFDAERPRGRPCRRREYGADRRARAGRAGEVSGVRRCSPGRSARRWYSVDVRPSTGTSSVMAGRVGTNAGLCHTTGGAPTCAFLRHHTLTNKIRFMRRL